MIETIRTLPIEQVISGITHVAEAAREFDRELTLALAYAHRVMTPPLSLRTLSVACGLSPFTIRARVLAPGVLEDVREYIEAAGYEVPELTEGGGHESSPPGLALSSRCVTVVVSRKKPQGDERP